MGFLSKLLGRDGPPQRYRTEAEYKQNRLSRIKSSRSRWQALEATGQWTGDDAQLEFRFRTANRGSARKLSKALESRGYRASVQEEADGTLRIAGPCPAMQVTEKSIVSWTSDMCRFGYEHDAEFEGWEPA